MTEELQALRRELAESQAEVRFLKAENIELFKQLLALNDELKQTTKDWLQLREMKANTVICEVV